MAGANVTIVGGLGTGSGGGGSVILQAQPPGGPGSGVTITPRTALTIQAPAGGSAAIAAYATYTFSQLPACAAGIQGSGAVISDGPASPAWHQTVSTGGGTTPMKLFCNGSAWTVEAY